MTRRSEKSKEPATIGKVRLYTVKGMLGVFLLLTLFDVIETTKDRSNCDRGNGQRISELHQREHLTETKKPRESVW